MFCGLKWQTETFDFIFQWEPKPTRMLSFELTDGQQIVRGMEYESIPQLTLQNVDPGAKVKSFVGQGSGAITS